MRANARGLRALGLASIGVVALTSPEVGAAEDWIEVKTANFTVVSNAGDRSTRKLAWQLEQVRSAMRALWSWAKPDLNKPLSVIAVKDEESMRSLAPRFWEVRNAVRPASVWVTGPDQHYLAIRTDIEIDTKGTINPYLTAYSSYVSLVLSQSFDRELPQWFLRGFSDVLGNTVVKDDHLLLGAPTPWSLDILRGRPLLTLSKLLAATRLSRELTEAERRQVFDAEAWALVHFLMFGDNGKRSGGLNAFAKLVIAGTDPSAAFAEALGPIEALEASFRVYIQRNIFSFARVNLDVGVERERFPVRLLAAAESASARALFHAAMGRIADARASIAEARKADANAAASYTAEGLLLDRQQNRDAAKVAYARAVELGTSSAYAHYRLASLKWETNPSPELQAEIDTLLSKAIERNVRYAAAYAWLGDIRAARGAPSGMGLIRRAIALEPREARHRLRAAHVLIREGRPAEARIEAQAALKLAEDEQERRDAQELLERIAKGGD
jgi:tetratricopeptide (TPR) repeat protein